MSQNLTEIICVLSPVVVRQFLILETRRFIHCSVCLRLMGLTEANWAKLRQEVVSNRPWKLFKSRFAAHKTVNIIDQIPLPVCIVFEVQSSHAVDFCLVMKIRPHSQSKQIQISPGIYTTLPLQILSAELIVSCTYTCTNISSVDALKTIYVEILQEFVAISFKQMKVL